MPDEIVGLINGGSNTPHVIVVQYYCSLWLLVEGMVLALMLHLLQLLNGQF